MKILIEKIKRNLNRLSNIAKQSGKGYFGAVWYVYKLSSSRGFCLTEIHDNEIDLGTKEYVDTFLNDKEQIKYLELLNPRFYSRVARNKYFTHTMLEAAGIKEKSELYLYYNPELGTCAPGRTANDVASAIDILRSKDVKSCVIKTTEDSHGDNVIVVNDIIYGDGDAELLLYNGKKTKLSEILGKAPLIFESVIEQTEQMRRFNASSVNTVRFMTVLHPNGEARIIATFIKIGRAGTCVDNAGGGGNIDAGVNVADGTLYNAIRYEGPRNCKKIDRHPDSQELIEGVKIENWDAICRKVLEFQKAMPFVKAAGWDIAITPAGPVIVELNDMWDRIGQLFRRKGWKPEIKACYDDWTRYYQNK